MSRRGVASALASVVLLAATPARADSPTKQECVSANESAQDLQHAGKLREARTRLATCVAASCPGPVREDCAQRLAEVDKAMPTLILVARDSDGNDLSAVRVEVDGQPFVERLDGTALPVDPGPHRFVLEVAGLPAAEKSLVVHEGERGRRETVVFGPRPPAPVAAPTPAPRAETPHEAPAADAPGQAHGRGRTQRLVGLVLGGIGVAGLGVGSVFGVLSKITYDHALSTECGSAAGFSNPKTCTDNGVNDVHTANGQALVSTVGVIAGAALLGGGAYLYFTAAKASEVTVGPSVGAGGAGVTLRATW